MSMSGACISCIVLAHRLIRSRFDESVSWVHLVCACMYIVSLLYEVSV